MKKNRFNVDFFEFAFLVEACIPPRPIARTFFWQKVINEHYFELTKDERLRLYEWMHKSPCYTDGLNDKNEDCLIFEARFNPDSQYLITTQHDGETKTTECFEYNDRYHTSLRTSILEEFIINIEKLS